ncbi:MAG TPA: response regulator [Rhizomicrobium sp.]|nr:response regulator [Rhizomicrobium sp.]
MEKIALLVVDDDADVRRAARLALTGIADTQEAASLGEMEARLADANFDAVLLDMNFSLGLRSGQDGLDGLTRIRDADPDLAVVLMTAFGAVSLAVESLKRGGADFLLKPWRNDALAAAVAAAATRTREKRALLPLDNVERAAIARALRHHDGNIAQAAAALGVSRPALYRRISKYGL